MPQETGAGASWTLSLEWPVPSPEEGVEGHAPQEHPTPLGRLWG